MSQQLMSPRAVPTVATTAFEATASAKRVARSAAVHLSVFALLVLSACGPISPQIAADQCEERARQADGPFGELQVGTLRGRAAGSIEVGITSDYISGRDPYEVYDTCVRAKTGQGPVRPLELRR